MTVAEWIRRRVEGINPKNNARVTPDPGSSDGVKASTLLDKTQKFVENVDGGVANAGALANLASLTKIPYIARAGGIVTGVASKAEPLMLALTALDAGRALVDKDYRKANLDSIKNLEANPKSGVFGGALDTPYFNTTVALQALERPVSTSSALIRYAMEAREQLAKSKETDKKTDLKLKKLKKQYSDQQAKEDADRQSRFLRSVATGSPYIVDKSEQVDIRRRSQQK